MTLIRYDQLTSAFDAFEKKGGPPAFFLIFGDSYLLKQSFQKLSSYLLHPDNPAFALESLDGMSITMGDIIEKVSTFSFLFSKKVVAVKNAGLFQSNAGKAGQGFSASDLDHLAAFIEKGGIPPGHFLVFMTPEIDKRRKSYKTLEDKGLVIDCSVARGDRKADQDEQAAVLGTLADEILSKAGKTIDRKAFHLLLDLTGIDLELFSRNLEKLIVYSGKKTQILEQDVLAVVTRDKKDPIFKLTNAFMEKDIQQALLFLNSLFKDGSHPLQILKLFENQVRRLILVKSLSEKLNRCTGPMDFKTMNFTRFKQIVLPQVMEQDKEILKRCEKTEPDLPGSKAKKKTGGSNDLLLAPNPQNAYPVFQVFQKSQNFTISELQQAVFYLSDLDYRLKSSSFDAKTAFEGFIINTCRKGGFEYANENQNRRYYF